MKNAVLLFLAFTLMVSCNQIQPPAAEDPLPADRQLKWHEMEFYAFVHFNMNTFTDMEWGTGGESPRLFNPTELDCRQWARVCKVAGIKGIILTAKYGTDTYLTYFRNQLTELITNYGEVDEVWFDGANGGTGYYGGANEERRVDRKTYYDWPNTRQIVRDLQPDAVMFSDAGPGVRWVGNEAGWAGETNWSILRRDEFYPGSPNYKDLTSGHEDGTHWVPAEVEVSIRPG